MSKKYFLYKEQEGQGCDYTIGCGSSFEEVEANSLNDAIDQVVDLPDDWDQVEDEDELHDNICESGISMVKIDNCDRLNTIELYEISKVVDLIPILKAKLAEVDAVLDGNRAKAKEAAERAQFEKLKKKFG